MPPEPSHVFDATIVAAYLLVSVAVGVWASRWLGSKSQTEEDYYLAGRKMPGWLNGISVAVTAMNADVAPFYCGLAVVIGLPMVWFYASRFAVAWMILALLFAVRWRQMNVRTGPEFYALRFGGTGARFVRAYTAVFSVTFNMVPWIGAGMLGVHKIAGPVFGIEEKTVTLSIILPLLVGYVWISGFAGVLVTDVLQSLVIVAASVMLLVMVIVDAGGPVELAAAIREAHPQEHAEILSPFPVAGHEVMGPLIVLVWFIVPTVGRGGSLDLDGQRLLSCRNPREAAKVPIWGTAALFLMLLLLTLPVLGMLAKYPGLYHAETSEREAVYGMLLAEYLPAGFLGIAIAALLASVMSTIDSHLNYGAQTLVNDFLRQAFPAAAWLDPQRSICLWVGRLVMLVMLGGAIAVVYQAESLFAITAVVLGMLATVATFYWGQWWWWRVNVYSWISAMVGGPVVYLVLGASLDRWTWWKVQLDASPANADFLAMIQALFAMLLTTLLWMAVTLWTRPQPMSQLIEFYRRARPMGLWEPVRTAILAESPEEALPPRRLLAGGLGLAVFGGSWLTLTCLGLAVLAVGRWSLGVAWLAIAGGLFVLFRRGFQTHMTRLDA